MPSPSKLKRGKKKIKFIFVRRIDAWIDMPILLSVLCILKRIWLNRFTVILKSCYLPKRPVLKKNLVCFPSLSPYDESPFINQLPLGPYSTSCFFYYPPSSGIASCVGTAGTVTWHLHLTRPCCVALGLALIWILSPDWVEDIHKVTLVYANDKWWITTNLIIGF